MTEVVCFL